MAKLSTAGWDVFLFGIPLIAFLIFSFFKLDQVFTFRKRDRSDHSAEPPRKRQEGSMRSDPDGRPWDED